MQSWPSCWPVGGIRPSKYAISGSCGTPGAILESVSVVLSTTIVMVSSSSSGGVIIGRPRARCRRRPARSHSSCSPWPSGVVPARSNHRLHDHTRTRIMRSSTPGTPPESTPRCALDAKTPEVHSHLGAASNICSVSEGGTCGLTQLPRSRGWSRSPRRAPHRRAVRQPHT